MTRVVVVRHGNTFGPGEASRRIGARTNLPLVASGREQAAMLAGWFAQQDISFDTVLSSPSRRCLETAGLITPGQRAIVTEWLDEIDHGPDEGLPEDQVVRRVGTAAIQRWDSDALPPDGWVVGRDARIEAWRAFFREVSAPTLLVTSNGAARFALIAAGVQRHVSGLKLRTGALGEFTVEDGRAALINWDLRPVEATSSLVARRR